MAERPRLCSQVRFLRLATHSRWSRSQAFVEVGTNHPVRSIKGGFRLLLLDVAATPPPAEEGIAWNPYPVLVCAQTFRNLDTCAPARRRPSATNIVN